MRSSWRVGRIALFRAIIASIGIIGGVGPLAGCGSGRGDPAKVVERFVVATRNGDRVAVYQDLGPRTRGRIESTMRAAKRVGGRLELKPYDLLSVGHAPPTWESATIRTVEVNGDRATVSVQSSTGDRHDVELVSEGRAWKIELSGP